MSELSSICEYCLRPSDGVQSCCAHCGAPLRAIASRLESGVHASAELAREAEKSAMRMGGVAAAVGAAGVATASRALASRGRTMLGQLLAVVIGLAAILVAVVVVLRSCAAAVPIGGLGTPFESLPATLRFAADCRSVDGEQSAQRCVIPADSMLLSGSVSGGRDLMLTVDIVPASKVSSELTRWRSTATSVLTDGDAFVAIGPSNDAWYADVRSGLSVETGPMVNAAAARTFLMRAGLLTH